MSLALFNGKISVLEICAYLIRQSLICVSERSMSVIQKSLDVSNSCDYHLSVKNLFYKNYSHLIRVSLYVNICFSFDQGEVDICKLRQKQNIDT